jgi:hypothetical protein
MKTFNLYCDESCHLENDNKNYMLLAYICVPYNQLNYHKKNLKKLRKEYDFNVELKWTKVSKSKFSFYEELIEYFFGSDLFFRAIIINKEKFDSSVWGTFDDFYYKMYYQLIYHKLDTLCTYNIYLDIKDTLSAKKVKKLKEILQSQYGIIHNLQNIHSKESDFIQLTDFIMGAVSYSLRNLQTSPIKTMLVNRLKKLANHDFMSSTSTQEEKFNLFFIELK